MGGRGGDVTETVGNAGHIEASTGKEDKLMSAVTRAHHMCAHDMKAQEGENSLLADGVLVDAPCSSLGTLRRGPNVRWEINEAFIKQFPSLQYEILKAATRLVKVGGVLVYATCTIHHAENQDIADQFEAEFGESFESAPLVEAWGEVVSARVFGPVARHDDNASKVQHRVQLLPHHHNTDGFFIARWRRKKPL